MKRLTQRTALSLFAALAFSTSASAGVILDTGAGAAWGGGGWALDGSQSLATSFTLSQASVITGVNGWIGGLPGTLRVSVMSSANSVPVATLFSADAAATWGPNSWVGVSGMQLRLDAGTYFAAFSVPAGYTYGGGMGNDAPHPTPGAYAYAGNWTQFANIGIGAQVFGDAAPANVPEPASVALLGLGIAGLALSRRKRA